MATLLHLDSSPRTGSYSRLLSSAFVEGFLAADPEARVIRRDLVLSPPPFVDEAWVQNAFLPPADRAPGSLAVSDELTDEFLAADVIAIGMPMYNWGVPANVKAWIDQIVRAGRTFSMDLTPGAFVGMASGRTVVGLVARNGPFLPGEPYEKANFQDPYLAGVMSFVGITDTRLVALQDVYGPELERRLPAKLEEARALGDTVATERSTVPA